MTSFERTLRSLQRMANGFDGDSILHSIGLERRDTFARVLGGFGLLAIGAVVGGGVALALSPMSGKRLREKVTMRLGETRDRVTEGMHRLQARVQGQRDQGEESQTEEQNATAQH